MGSRGDVIKECHENPNQYLEILFQSSINNRHPVRVYIALGEWSLRLYRRCRYVSGFNKCHFFPEESKYVTYNQQTAPSQRTGSYKSRLVLIAHTDCCMRTIYSYHSRVVERTNGPSNTNVTIWIQGVLGKGDGTYERYTRQQRAWKETSASRFGIVRYQHMYSFVRQSNGLKIKGVTVQYLPARTPVSESWAIVFILPLKHVIIFTWPLFKRPVTRTWTRLMDAQVPASQVATIRFRGRGTLK